MVDVSELKGWESTYMRCFNFIMSRGWYREDKKWCSPDGKYRFSNIEAAFRCAKFYEDIIER